ncbi:MAG TPA: hypothetical protein VK509_09965 [Polyangiales bacterium]|nr:hypothetical protein [Polyangiales bacterium]
MSQPPKPAAPQRDPVPSLAHEVIALFEDALAGVRFPELDHERLEHMAAAARAAQVELERTEAELLQAQARVAEHAASLLTCAERGLAYARVFAQGDDALSARVAQLGSQPASATKREEPGKRRTRKQSNRGDGAALFADETHPPAQDADAQDGVAA